MQKIVLNSIVALVAALSAPFTFAEDIAPDAQLKAVTMEVIALIRQDSGIKAGDPTKVADLVESKILPHFDFNRMTQLAAARGWSLATPEQQQALTTEFKILLVRTYSTALSGYRDQVIEFKPLRAVSGDTDVTVKSVIRQSGTAPVAMDYDVEHLATGWMVYDIKLDGVSLVTTYRESFAATIRDSGIAGLIKSLSEKNQRGDASHRPRQTGAIYMPGMILQAFAPRLFYTSLAR